MIHHEGGKTHPLAGQTVTIANGSLAGKVYRVEDWWDRVSGGSWMWAEGNPAAIKYAMRCGLDRLPMDDEVVYGHIDGFGNLVHVTELPAATS